MNTSLKADEQLWSEHHAQWRSPAEVINLRKNSADVNLELLTHTEEGAWWDLLSKLKIRLLVSREYEHLLLSLGAGSRGPEISFMSLPHPSGIAVDRTNKLVYIASTRNPNQVFTLAPAKGLVPRTDLKDFKKASAHDHANRLVPIKTHFLPGSLYIHDLSFIGKKLYANAVGHNAIVELPENGGYKYVWWPKIVDTKGGFNAKANYLQLNSIAAGKSIRDSFYSASASKILKYRPGHIRFPVDGQGVVFSGKTRQTICAGLTRPHSARLYQGKVWLDNSGYGEFGFVNKKNKFESIVKLPGWTRGLCIIKDVAFVGTSRVIPKFACYAPGLDVKKSHCAIYAVALKSGKVLTSLKWPLGNQIFAIDWIPRKFSEGFHYDYLPTKRSEHIKHLYYTFKT